MKAHISINKEHNGIEINFDSKPSADIREQLKSNGFRWHKVNKVWYAKNTGKTMELASKISREIGNGKELADQCAEIAREKFESLDIPGAKFVEGGGLYDGWEGGNHSKWHSDAELKECLRADFKKAGIKATFRFPRCGYLTSLVVTITLPRETSIKSYDEWLNGTNTLRAVNWWCGCGWITYRDSDGKIKDIHEDAVAVLPEDERERLGEIVRHFEYNRCIDIVQDENTHYKRSEDVLSESAAKALNLARRIVASYNRDCTNSMVDYFDRSIYDDYRIKFA